MKQYKKLAGTSAVFIDANHQSASPVERDGMIWRSDELGIDQLALNLRWKEPMASGLALEGLEDYEPASDGDARFVSSIGVAFAFVKDKQAWIQLTRFA